MHSSGSITRKFGPSWKQSTGHTSTQSVYLHLMQFSVTTKGISRRIHGFGRMTRDFRTLTRPMVEVSHSLRARSADLRVYRAPEHPRRSESDAASCRAGIAFRSVRTSCLTRAQNIHVLLVAIPARQDAAHCP